MSDRFSLGMFEHDGSRFVGIVVGDSVYDGRVALPHIADTVSMLAAWQQNLDTITSALDSGLWGDRSHSLAELSVLPPVQPVGPVIGAGANYRQHILEMSVAHKLGRADATDTELWDEAAIETDRRRSSGDPYVWTGLPSAVCGAFDDIQLPDVGEDIDWELELGVVIGRTAYRVAAEDASDYIAGYTIVNDITARSLVPRPDMTMLGTDWFRAKNQPTFFPTGPYLVPAQFVDDPENLRIELRLNGEVKQDALTDDMLFDIPSLIAYASSLVVLQPGDLLITGSPPGNGSHWGRFLTDGDVVEASITGLGQQRNAVRGPSGDMPPWQRSRS